MEVVLTLGELVQAFEEQRQQLIRACGTKREPTPAEKDGGAEYTLEVQADQLPSFQAAMTDLANIPVRIALSRVDLEALRRLQ